MVSIYSTTRYEVVGTIGVEVEVEVEVEVVGVGVGVVKQMVLKGQSRMYTIKVARLVRSLRMIFACFYQIVNRTNPFT